MSTDASAGSGGVGEVVLDVEVSPCRLLNDGSSYEDCSYQIRLQCTDMFGERKQFRSTRNLLDFCDLECRLMKVLTDLNLLSPFHELTMAVRRMYMEEQKKDDHNLANRFLNINLGHDLSNKEQLETMQYRPLFGADREKYARTMFDESLSQNDLIFKSTELKGWLVSLLNEPEVLDTISFGLFFSEEELCYRKQNIDNGETCPENHSDYAYLLAPKHMKTKTLISKHIEKIEVQRGQIVVWRFSSKFHDLAFSVDLNGRSLLGPKKYPSSSQEIFGSIEMTSSTSGVGNLVGNGLCEIKFDNKYSKMMAPTVLKYYCRAVDPVEYVDCKRRASERLELFNKKKEALEAVTTIFKPVAASLRDKGISGRRRSEGDLTVYSAQNSEKPPLDASSEPEGRLKEDDQVKQLLQENEKLRQENEELKKKCSQLQNKIDAVLNFANANSHSGARKERQQRRKTYTSSTLVDDPPVTSEGELHGLKADLENDSTLNDSKSFKDSKSVGEFQESTPQVCNTSNLDEEYEAISSEEAILQQVECDSDDDEDSD